MGSVPEQRILPTPPPRPETYHQPPGKPNRLPPRAAFLSPNLDYGNKAAAGRDNHFEGRVRDQRPPRPCREHEPEPDHGTGRTGAPTALAHRPHPPGRRRPDLLLRTLLNDAKAARPATATPPALGTVARPRGCERLDRSARASENWRTVLLPAERWAGVPRPRATARAATEAEAARTEAATALPRRGRRRGTYRGRG